MKYLLACLCLLFLVGCDGSRSRLNDGADLATYSASPQWMFQHIPAGLPKGQVRLDGYYDPDDGSITISEQLHGWMLARTYAHELGHAWDHQRPADIWELLARYQSPDFSFNPHPDEQLVYSKAALLEIPSPTAVQRALQAARDAAAVEANR